VEAYLRRRTGLAASGHGVPITRRIFASNWTWAAINLAFISYITLWIMLRDVMRDREAEDGSRIPGLNANALWMSAERALPTLLFWVICFILIDRYKPQRLLVWAIALAWGGCVAVMASYYINSWVGTKIAVVDGMPGGYVLRLAVFVAPFVEESTKACIIFLIVLIDRNRFASRVSGLVIGGLAGAGFAFTENIIYYARVIVYGSYTSGTGDVKAALDYLVLMRGVFTCFGHPMFTMMTGLGVAFAVTSRSKIIRVIAPLAGFLLGAFLHMFFNFFVSMVEDENLIPILLILVWPIVIGVVIRAVVSSIRQGRMISARLADYVAMGWLPPHYPMALSRMRSRGWTLFMSLFHGSVINTWKIQVRATELAALREAITRGTVDHGGLYRELEIINEIAGLARMGGMADGAGLRPYLPWNASRQRHTAALPQHRDQIMPPNPALMEVAGPPIKYSAVDPAWRPPV